MHHEIILVYSGWVLCQVCEMIETGQCAAIQDCRSSQLVAWCLTYDDGALGMLYTVPAFRGQSLARQCVLETIRKRAPNLLQPFCFIEVTNDISRRLFTSLGFVKNGTVVWAGIKQEK
jgi:predicted GNAT family acetyltransferase